MTDNDEVLAILMADTEGRGGVRRESWSVIDGVTSGRELVGEALGNSNVVYVYV